MGDTILLHFRLGLLAGVLALERHRPLLGRALGPQPLQVLVRLPQALVHRRQDLVHLQEDSVVRLQRQSDLVHKEHKVPHQQDLALRLEPPLARHRASEEALALLRPLGSLVQLGLGHQQRAAVAICLARSQRR